MKILITGSSGYIGNNFINQYKNKYQFEKFSLLEQELKNINFVSIDIVLHCAALVHQKVKHTNKKYYEINVDYPVKLAKLAKENGVKHFVYISSIAVYDIKEKYLTEDTNCIPATFYGKSKLEGEKQLFKLDSDNFKVSIIRLPMVYGKNAPGNIYSLIKLVKKSSIIPLGGIENKRNFISIQNLCHFIDEVIQQRQEGIFLASDDSALSTSKLIELIANNLNKKVYLIKIPLFETLLKLLKPSFHKRLYCSLEVDNSITKEKLNLKNPYNVEEGIKYMIKGEDV